jgi:hypothetical protein
MPGKKTIEVDDCVSLEAAFQRAHSKVSNLFTLEEWEEISHYSLVLNKTYSEWSAWKDNPVSHLVYVFEVVLG